MTGPRRGPGYALRLIPESRNVGFQGVQSSCERDEAIGVIRGTEAIDSDRPDVRANPGRTVDGIRNSRLDPERHERREEARVILALVEFVVVRLLSHRLGMSEAIEEGVAEGAGEGGSR